MKLGGIATVQNAHGSRVLDASSLFLTYLTTNVESDEVLTEVAIPIMPPRSGQAIEEFSSCLMLGIQAQGHEITTVEGLAPDEEHLSPLQEAFWQEHGLQYGFCTSGILMTMSWFLKQNPTPTRAEIREALSGNLCRCTGYQNIVTSVERAAETLRARSS